MDQGRLCSHIRLPTCGTFGRRWSIWSNSSSSRRVRYRTFSTLFFTMCGIVLFFRFQEFRKDYGGETGNLGVNPEEIGKVLMFCIELTREV